MESHGNPRPPSNRARKEHRGLAVAGEQSLEAREPSRTNYGFKATTNTFAAISSRSFQITWRLHLSEARTHTLGVRLKKKKRLPAIEDDLPDDLEQHFLKKRDSFQQGAYFDRAHFTLADWATRFNFALLPSVDCGDLSL